MPSYTVGYIDVYRNGVRLVNNGTDFVATTGTTVVLNNACTVGDSVVTESFLVSSVLNAIPATAGAISLTSATYLSGILPVAYGGTGLSAGSPAFSAYANATQSITSGVPTKVAINAELFDTNSNFDSTTNYRFTPTVEGYYQVNGTVRNGAAGANATQATASIYKNGSVYARGTDLVFSASSMSNLSCTVNEVVYMNGTTDYVELYGSMTGTTPTFTYATINVTSRFSAAMVRGA